MCRKILLTITVLIFFTIFSFGQEKCQKEEILKPDSWNAKYKNYNCDPSIIDILKKKIVKADTIDIYFGFWCSDSRENVPKFISLLEKVNSDDLKINYYKVGRKKKGQKFYVDKLKVERVPTFIVLKNNKEIGRIIENPVKSLCEDLLEILF